MSEGLPDRVTAVNGELKISPLPHFSALSVEATRRPGQCWLVGGSSAFVGQAAKMSPVWADPRPPAPSSGVS